MSTFTSDSPESPSGAASDPDGSEAVSPAGDGDPLASAEAPPEATEEVLTLRPSATQSAAADAAAVFGASMVGTEEPGATSSEEEEEAETEAEAEAAEVADEVVEVVTEDDLLGVEEEPTAAPSESPYDRPGAWYVVHTQSGYEKKVQQNLEARIQSMNMEHRIYEVVIPMEDVVEFRGGKKVVVPKKMFPGYLLVRCALDDDSWYVIRNTPGITGFVGQGNKPSPLRRREVEEFLAVKLEGDEAAPKRMKPRLEYEMGETVRVREGPFADFSGEVIEINEDQSKVKVLVNIFGRETPVELEFGQVARL